MCDQINIFHKKMDYLPTLCRYWMLIFLLERINHNQTLYLIQNLSHFDMNGCHLDRIIITSIDKVGSQNCQH